MSPETDDQELIRRMIAGDPVAIEYFDHKYRQRFLLIAHRSGVPFPDTEDVAQNALMDALRQLPQFRWECSLGHWLDRILRGKIVNRWRALPPPSVQLVEDRPERGENDSPSRSLVIATPATQDLVVEVRSVLNAMPPKLAVLLKLNLLGGLSAREIAERLGCPQKVVSRNLTKAKELFREIVMRDEKSAENSRQDKGRSA